MTREKYHAAGGALLLAVVVAGGILAASKPEEIPIEVRTTPEQVVLYTIHRGPLGKVGSTIAELMTTAMQKDAYTSGPISFTYLTDFEAVSSEHWLTEIRVPVAQETLSLAGTLGKFTDVKKLAGVEVAMTGKPEGLASPEPIYERLYTWIFENGYLPTEGPSEAFLTNAETQDYYRMKTEIMVPLRKVSKTR